MRTNAGGFYGKGLRSGGLPSSTGWNNCEGGDEGEIDKKSQ